VPTGRRPLAVALTGSIGAGKSEALKAFARHGAATIASDEIVHGLLRDDPDVRSAVAARWGGELVGPSGVDREAVARIVFADREELEWLETLLHPKVVAEQAAWRDEVAARPDPPAVCVVEIPLLYETGGESRFDAVVVVTAPAAVRHERRGDVSAREARLLPDEAKVARATFAYVNDGTLDELDAFVAGTMEVLVGGTPGC
jgi:dephospho-CoA kinase